MSARQRTQSKVKNIEIDDESNMDQVADDIVNEIFGKTTSFNDRLEEIVEESDLEETEEIVVETETVVEHNAVRVGEDDEVNNDDDQELQSNFYVFDFLIITVMFVHLLMTPYSKVEESFTLQAVYDILNHGISNISQYDHVKFPGVVPRTFISPLIVALFVKPLSFVNNYYNDSVIHTQLNVQFLTRSVVLLTNAFSLIYLRKTAQRTDSKWMNREAAPMVEISDKNDPKITKERFANVNKLAPSSSIGIWFTLFTLSQFHIMFYSSRTLPNFVLSLPLCNYALALCLNGNYHKAIGLLAFGGIVFRMELGVFCIALSVVWFYSQTARQNKKQIAAQILQKIFLGVLTGGALSFLVDSYFWSKWTIPELESFVFNIIDNQAQQWGTEPITAYFTKYLPMLFLPPTVLFLNYFGFQTCFNKNLRIIWYTSILYIAIMSLQPHKEWRFIVYSVPAITLLGASGASALFSAVDYKDNFGYIVPILVSFSPVASLFMALLFMYISSKNYPGGEALQVFNNYVVENNITNVTLHMDVPSCMSGVTLFGQLTTNNVTYDKTEDLEFLVENWNNFDYIMGSFPNAPASNNETDYKLIGKSKIFSGVNSDYLATVGQKYFNGIHVVQEMAKSRSTDLIHEFVDNIFIYSDAIYIWEKQEAQL